MMLKKKTFRVAFDFYESRMNALSNAPDWWEETAEMMHKILTAGCYDPFLMDLLVSVHAELERRALEQQGEGLRRGA